MDVVIAANLPYYITTPILFKIFESNADIAAITVMMQKEVADRFHAKVNTKEYNALSIITQYRCDVRAVMKVPKMFFIPNLMLIAQCCNLPFANITQIYKKNHFSQWSKLALNNVGRPS